MKDPFKNLDRDLTNILRSAVDGAPKTPKRSRGGAPTLTRAPSPNAITRRYPLPMEHANKALDQHIASTSAPPGSAPASSASTTTSGSAPNSRGVVSHRRKNWDKDFVAKTNTPATTTPTKQPPATPAPQSNLPPFALSLSKGPNPPPRRRAETTCKGSGGVQERGKAQ